MEDDVKKQSYLDGFITILEDINFLLTQKNIS